MKQKNSEELQFIMQDYRIYNMNIEDKIYKRLVEEYGLDNLKMTIGFDDNDYAPIVIFSR